MRFDELLYNDDVLDGLYAMHFEECTPIQEKAIPVILEGHDLLGIAQTGTGKTAAYLLPVIDLLADGGYPDDAINCIVMAPTRELAQQIDRQMQGFAYFMPVNSMAIYGGTDGKTFEQQKRGLKMGADVVIATPGRLLAHQSMGYVDLSRVSFFILDEADRMLDMGFYDDIMHIVAGLPKDCQMLMFSATMPPKIKKLADSILHNPVEVKLAIAKPADNIKQEVYFCGEGEKLDLLTHIFRQTPPQRVIVFSSSKLKIKDLTRQLRKRGFNVGEMHSDLDQSQREQMMMDFKANRVDVLLATDIVARGIDIDDITLVVNYDVPHDAEDYVHRIGRTARAGSGGRAATFVCPKERMAFGRIEQLIKMKVPRGEMPEELQSAGGNVRSGDSGRRRDGGNRGRSGRNRNGSRGRGNNQPQQPRNNQPQQPRNNQPQQPRGDKPQQPRDDKPQTEGQPSGKDKGRRGNHRHRHRKPGNKPGNQGAPTPPASQE